MDATVLLSIIGTVAATMGGKEAWAYYRKRLTAKTKIQLKGSAGETELREEIQDMLEEQIGELKEQIKLLTKRITDMEQERENDKKRIAKQDKQIGILEERHRKSTLKSRGRTGGNENEDISE